VSAAALTPALSRKRERGRNVTARAAAFHRARRSPFAPPLPLAGEGWGEGFRALGCATSPARSRPAPLAPPLPPAGEGRGEGFHAIGLAMFPARARPTPFAPPLPRAGEGWGEGGLT
jgi:hypothetical protein